MIYYIRPLITLFLCFSSAFTAQHFHDLEKGILAVFFTLFASACGIAFFIVVEDSYMAYCKDHRK